MSDTRAANLPDAEALAEQIAEIWREVLRIEELSADDDLPDLGSRSILIIEVALRIQKRFGVDLPLEVFIDTRTVRELAAAVAAVAALAVP